MLRKRHQYRILTAAFLFALVGLAFFAGGMGIRLQDESFINQTAKTPSSQSGPNNPEPESVWIRATTDPVAAATLLLAVATFLMAHGVYKQIRLARDAIELGNREFAATHRPKIRVAYIKLGPLQAGAQPSAEIWAINIGDGDAEISQLSADIFIRRGDRAGTAHIVAPVNPYPGTSPIVEPGQQANIGIVGREILRQENIDGINGSPNIARTPWLHLCVVGTVHYFDANRTHRLTSFFRVYNPQRLRFMRAAEDDEYAEWDYEA